MTSSIPSDPPAWGSSRAAEATEVHEHTPTTPELATADGGKGATAADWSPSSSHTPQPRSWKRAIIMGSIAGGVVIAGAVAWQLVRRFR